MEPAEATVEALTIEQAAHHLGVHYMTVYRYIRTGRLPAEYRDGRWHIHPGDLAQVQKGGRPRPPADGRPVRRGPATAGSGAERMLGRLVTGDSAGAWLIAEQSLLAGGPDDVYLGVLAPCLRTIGDMWADGRLTVADEHRATVLALGIVGRLGPLFGRRGRRRPGQVLLAGVEGDPHAIPVIMVSDLLRADGYEVVQLGADVPLDTLVASAASRAQLLAIGLSAGTTRTLERAGKAVAGLHHARPGVPVFLGGPAVPDEAAARAVGADGWAADAAGAVELIRQCGTGR
ncbi:MAG: cobalamin-dependent protein [Actinomycetota bacterium]|nr:cobalamin-dependent protein [Actinomycetota bacterium]